MKVAMAKTKLKQSAQFATKDSSQKTPFANRCGNLFPIIAAQVISFLVWRSEKCRENATSSSWKTSGLNKKT